MSERNRNNAAPERPQIMYNYHQPNMPPSAPSQQQPMQNNNYMNHPSQSSGGNMHNAPSHQVQQQNYMGHHQLNPSNTVPPGHTMMAPLTHNPNTTTGLPYNPSPLAPPPPIVANHMMGNKPMPSGVDGVSGRANGSYAVEMYSNKKGNATAMQGTKTQQQGGPAGYLESSRDSTRRQQGISAGGVGEPPNPTRHAGMQGKVPDPMETSQTSNKPQTNVNYANQNGTSKTQGQQENGGSSNVSTAVTNDVQMAQLRRNGSSGSKSSKRKHQSQDEQGQEVTKRMRKFASDSDSKTTSSNHQSNHSNQQSWSKSSHPGGKSDSMQNPSSVDVVDAVGQSHSNKGSKSPPRRSRSDSTGRNAQSPVSKGDSSSTVSSRHSSTQKSVESKGNLHEEAEKLYNMLGEIMKHKRAKAVKINKDVWLDFVEQIQRQKSKIRVDAEQETSTRTFQRLQRNHDKIVQEVRRRKDNECDKKLKQQREELEKSHLDKISNALNEAEAKHEQHVQGLRKEQEEFIVELLTTQQKKQDEMKEQMEHELDNRTRMLDAYTTVTSDVFKTMQEENKKLKKRAQRGVRR